METKPKTKQDYEKEIDALDSKRQALEGLLNKLMGLLEDLRSEDKKLREGVLEPISQYKLGGASDADWLGANFTKAGENKTTIDSNLSNYAGQISTLESEIQEVIDQLKAKIEALKKEIRSLNNEKKSAPDESELEESNSSDSDE